MDQFITKEVPEIEGDEAKDSHKRSMDKAKRIIADSIRDHLIPHVSSFKILKELYDALTKVFEGKNINQKITHHTQLEDRIGWVDHFRAWKYIISLILEENDLDQYIIGEVP